MGDIRRRIVERVPSIGRGQILSADDAPARVDAGIELELGPASDDRVPMRTWPEQVDPVHGRAGISTSGPGELLFPQNSVSCSSFDVQLGLRFAAIDTFDTPCDSNRRTLIV